MPLHTISANRDIGEREYKIPAKLAVFSIPVTKRQAHIVAGNGIAIAVGGFLKCGAKWYFAPFQWPK